MSVAQDNTIYRIAQWFETAKPEDTRSVRDVQVQTGVHFEEVAEMLQEISGLDGDTALLLAKAKKAMSDLAEHFKTSADIIFVIDADRHKDYLDSLCDQVVTATGVAQYMLYRFPDALDEVDRSNWSKFVDGECVKDANGKIAKGPDYFKANLAQYVN